MRGTFLEMSNFTDLWVPSVMNFAVKESDWPESEKTERIANCLLLAAEKGGEFWQILEKAVHQIISDYRLPPSAENFLLDQVKDKKRRIVNFMAPFMLFGQEELTLVAELIQKGLIYDLILQIEGTVEPRDVLEPLIRSMANSNHADIEPISENHTESEMESQIPEPEVENEVQLDIDNYVVVEPVVEKSFVNSEISIDYDSHLLEREQVRKLIDNSTKRNQEAVSLLAAAVTPIASGRPPIPPSYLKTEAKTPLPKPFNFDDSTDMFSEGQPSPSTFQKRKSIDSSTDDVVNTELDLPADKSPNESLFNKTGYSEVADANLSEFTEVVDEINESSLDQSEKSNDPIENIFDWDGVKMGKKTTFKDSHPLRCCRFSPVDRTYVVGSNTKTLRRFARPLESDTEPKLLEEIEDLHDASIYCVDIAPNGKYIVTGSNDKVVKILRVDETNGIRVVSEMTNHDGTIRAVRFLPGGDFPTVLASGGAGDGRIYITDVTTDQILKYAQPAQRSVVTDIAPVSHDLLYIASGSKVLQWDLREKTPMMLDIDLPVQSLSANDTTANFLSTGCESGCVAFWDTRNTTLPLYRQKAHSKAIRSISMKGNWLLAGSMDETISLHNLQKSQNLLSMECGDRVISVDLDYKIEAAITNQADGSCIYWDISFQ